MTWVPAPSLCTGPKTNPTPLRHSILLISSLATPSPSPLTQKTSGISSSPTFLASCSFSGGSSPHHLPLLFGSPLASLSLELQPCFSAPKRNQPLAELAGNASSYISGTVRMSNIRTALAIATATPVQMGGRTTHRSSAFSSYGYASRTIIPFFPILFLRLRLPDNKISFFSEMNPVVSFTTLHQPIFPGHVVSGPVSTVSAWYYLR
jgi:hypothetical protein